MFPRFGCFLDLGVHSIWGFPRFGCSITHVDTHTDTETGMDKKDLSLTHTDKEKTRTQINTYPDTLQTQKEVGTDTTTDVQSHK